MKVKKLKNGKLKIKKDNITVIYDEKPQQLIYDDSNFIFGVYLGKWKRLKTDFKKLQFLRNLLMFLYDEDEVNDLLYAYKISEKAAKMFNELEKARRCNEIVSNT